MPIANLSKEIKIPIAASVETTIESLPKTSVFYDTVYVKKLLTSKSVERIYLTDLEDDVEILSAMQTIGASAKSLKAKDYIDINLDLASNVFYARHAINDNSIFNRLMSADDMTETDLNVLSQTVMEDIGSSIISKIDSIICNKFKEHSTEIDVPTVFNDPWITKDVFQSDVFRQSVSAAFGKISESKFGVPPNASLKVILPSSLQTRLPFCDASDVKNETAIEYLNRYNAVGNGASVEIAYSEKLKNDAIVTTVKDKRAYIGGISAIDKNNIDNFIEVRQHPYVTEIICSMAFDLQVVPEYYDGATPKTYKSVLLKNII